MFLGIRATGRFARTGSQLSQAEEEEGWRQSLSQDLLNSGSNSQEEDLGLIDPALFGDLDALEFASEPSSQSPHPAFTHTPNAIPIATPRPRHQREESPSPATHKRPRNSRSSLASLASTMAEANEEEIYQRTHGVPSKQERAVGILEADYGNRYSTDDMVKAVCLFQDRSKTCVFLGLSAGLVRDAWLRGQLDM